jgi:hypothetical protein
MSLPLLMKSGEDQAKGPRAIRLAFALAFSIITISIKHVLFRVLNS